MGEETMKPSAVSPVNGASSSQTIAGHSEERVRAEPADDSPVYMKVYMVVRAIARWLLILINNILVVGPYLVLMLFLTYTLKPRNPQLYWQIEGTLFRLMLSFVAFWMWNAGYKVVEAGENIDDILEDEAIIMSNHQSTGDVPVMFYLLQSKRSVAGRVLWIMDVMFKYTHFGAVSLLRGDFFIRQGRDTRDLQGPMLRQHMHDYYWSTYKQWIVLFPEGGFLRKRREASQRYALKNNYPVLQHVTLPRVGALQVMLESMSPRGLAQHGNPPKEVGEVAPLKWLIDVTIGYKNARPLDMQTIVGGSRAPVDTVCYFRKFPISALPLETEPLTKWMYDRFVEKEALLDAFYKNGSFPEHSDTVAGEHAKIMSPKVIGVSYMYVLFILLLELTLAWTQYRVITNLWQGLAYCVGFIF